MYEKVMYVIIISMRKYRDNCKGRGGWMLYDLLCAFSILSICLLSFFHLLSLIQQQRAVYYKKMQEIKKYQAKAFLLAETLLALGLSVFLSLMIALLFSVLFRVQSGIKRDQIELQRELFIDLIAQDLSMSAPRIPITDAGIFVRDYFDESGQLAQDACSWSLEDGCLIRRLFSCSPERIVLGQKQKSIFPALGITGLTIKQIDQHDRNILISYYYQGCLHERRAQRYGYFITGKRKT